MVLDKNGKRIWKGASAGSSSVMMSLGLSKVGCIFPMSGSAPIESNLSNFLPQIEALFFKYLSTPAAIRARWVQRRAGFVLHLAMLSRWGGELCGHLGRTSVLEEIGLTGSGDHHLAPCPKNWGYVFQLMVLIWDKGSTEGQG